MTNTQEGGLTAALASSMSATIAGKERKLRLDLDVLPNIERMCGRNLMFTPPIALGFVGLRAVLWCAMTDEDRKEFGSPEAFGRAITPREANGLMFKVGELWKANMPLPDDIKKSIVAEGEHGPFDLAGTSGSE